MGAWDIIATIKPAPWPKALLSPFGNLFYRESPGRKWTRLPPTTFNPKYNVSYVHFSCVIGFSQFTCLDGVVKVEIPWDAYEIDRCDFGSTDGEIHLVLEIHFTKRPDYSLTCSCLSKAKDIQHPADIPILAIKDKVTSLRFVIPQDPRRGCNVSIWRVYDCCRKEKFYEPPRMFAKTPEPSTPVRAPLTPEDTPSPIALDPFLQNELYGFENIYHALNGLRGQGIDMDSLECSNTETVPVENETSIDSRLDQFLQCLPYGVRKFENGDYFEKKDAVKEFGDIVRPLKRINERKAPDITTNLSAAHLWVWAAQVFSSDGPQDDREGRASPLSFQPDLQGPQL